MWVFPVFGWGTPINQHLSNSKALDVAIFNYENEIRIKTNEKTKKVVIYPSMWVEPTEKDTIFISDAYVKYAKPYAVQKILDSF